jgi:hypothetical protein
MSMPKRLPHVHPAMQQGSQQLRHTPTTESSSTHTETMTPILSQLILQPIEGHNSYPTILTYCNCNPQQSPVKMNQRLMLIYEVRMPKPRDRQQFPSPRKMSPTNPHENISTPATSYDGVKQSVNHTPTFRLQQSHRRKTLLVAVL